MQQAAGKSTREVTQMLAAVNPELAAPHDRLRALGDGRWELKVVIDGECQRGLEELRMLLSHVDPHLTLGKLVGRLVPGSNAPSVTAPLRLRSSSSGAATTPWRRHWPRTLAVTATRRQAGRQCRAGTAPVAPLRRRSQPCHREAPVRRSIIPRLIGTAAPRRRVVRRRTRGPPPGRVPRRVTFRLP